MTHLGEPYREKRTNHYLTHLGEKDYLTDDDRKSVAQAIKHVSGWEQMKLGGVAAAPQGEPSAALQRAIKWLSEQGVFVVPVGVLERWHPEVGNKQTWVPVVLGRRLHEVENHQLSTFLRSVLSYLRSTVE